MSHSTYRKHGKKLLVGIPGLSREQCEELEEISKDKALKKFADNNFWKLYFNKDPKTDPRILGNIVKSWRVKQAANLQEKHEDSKSKHDDQLSLDLPGNSSVQQSCSQTGDSRPKVGQGPSVRVSVSVIITVIFKLLCLQHTGNNGQSSDLKHRVISDNVRQCSGLHPILAQSSINFLLIIGLSCAKQQSLVASSIRMLYILHMVAPNSGGILLPEQWNHLLMLALTTARSMASRKARTVSNCIGTTLIIAESSSQIIS